MRKRSRQWGWPLALWLAWAVPAPAQVQTPKSITRDEAPVVVSGSDLTDFLGETLNNADVTASPNKVFVWAYDGGSGWRQVVFQIDEVNNTYPSGGPFLYKPCGSSTIFSKAGHGPNYYDADDGVWDNNDELVFLGGELGDQVSAGEWPPGADPAGPRYEVEVEDPLNPGQKGWAYVVVHPTLPSWTGTSYIQWNEATNTVDGVNYTVSYPDNDARAMYFEELRVKAARGGTGTNLVTRERWNSRFYFTLFSSNVARDETQMRTIFDLGCYSNGTDGVAPWLAKGGPVRVSRTYWTNPEEGAFYSGDHPWRPRHFVQYYPDFWHENLFMNHSCPGCSARCRWLQQYIDHNGAYQFSFYSSNGDATTIDGTGEAVPTTPLWDWHQASSDQGSYVKIYPATYMPVNSGGSVTNYYVDDGTASGDTGLVSGSSDVTQVRANPSRSSSLPSAA